MRSSPKAKRSWPSPDMSIARPVLQVGAVVMALGIALVLLALGLTGGAVTAGSSRPASPSAGSGWGC
jgi:hypothetical protein